MLYPKANKYRDVYNLNGIWNYKTVGDDYIPTEKARGTGFMAVPASCNDIVIDKNIKDHVGKFLFETTFSIPVRDAQQYRIDTEG